MKRILLLIAFIQPLLTIAQDDHKISPLEKLQMPAYLQRINSNTFTGITLPPSSPVRASAEWEEIDALMITWTSFPAILTQIVQAAQNETKVIIVCSDSNAVKNSLTGSGVSLSNIDYLVAPFDRIWARDYGQWNIYTNDVDSLALVDWIYNRPRYNDDSVPVAIHNYTGLPLYRTLSSPFDLIHTGGNFMCDGFGTGFSSKLILNENPTKTEAQVDTIMKKFMGINRYIKMETLPYDDIHHIDMHIKLLDEETLLVGEYPAGIADGPQIEANLQYVLSNFNSVYGTPYKVIRIPMPPDAANRYPNQSGDYRTYANSVFVNKTVILPVYDPQYDSTALRIYREALPGYNVVGVNCNSIITQLGAIHCITKEVAASDPLLISHQALHDTYNTSSPYDVIARIQHRSGIQQAMIYYRTDTTLQWQSVPMSPLTSITHEGQIPPQPAGTTVYYYIDAQSVSGKTQVRPLTAPAGYWKFNVLLNTGISNSDKPILIENVFPNPSKGMTCIPVYTPSNSQISLSLRNILNEEVMLIYNGMNTGDKKYFINTSDISSGVYILQLKTETGIFSQKLIIR